MMEDKNQLQLHDPPTDIQPEEKKNKGCCKKVLKFVFSHIGLCGMVIAYSVAGGFIFEHLEKTNEKQECVKAMEKYTPAENDTVYKLWQISENFRDDEYMNVALQEFQKILRKFRTTVLELGYDGSNCTIMGEEGGPGYQWSFPGALLFSVTVITTIGRTYIYLYIVYSLFLYLDYDSTIHVLHF